MELRKSVDGIYKKINLETESIVNGQLQPVECSNLTMVGGRFLPFLDIV